MRPFILLAAVCRPRGASAACGGFGFACNTATTFDVVSRLQVTNFDVSLLRSAPNGPNYIDVWEFVLHGQLFRSRVRFRIVD